jgi:4-amino-4-deoxy-L-arabinose transferase-like glycosyltransferase
MLLEFLGMNEQELDFDRQKTFCNFLRTHRRWVLLILLLGFTLRIAFLIYWPPDPDRGDAKARYIPTAINLSEGNGFSIDKSPPYKPSLASMPIYPLFIAATYSIFGSNPNAVSVIQIILDLLTCLMVAFISFSLSPPAMKNRAALFSLIIYGIFCWFTLVLAAWLLTETIAIFLTMLTVSLCILGLRKNEKGHKYWLGSGLACGIAILTRPDSVLLAGAIILFLLLLTIWQRSWFITTNILCFGFAMVLVLLPWTIRNYYAFGKLEPLASEWGFADPTGYMPRGYLQWIRTWMTDETYFYYVFNQAFFPGTEPFKTDALPDKFFDSEEEHQQVINLMNRYNETLYFTPEIENEFRQIAEQRISRNPLRFYVFLPVKRIASLWLTGFTTTSGKTNYKLVLRILSVLPIILGGLLGFLKWCHPWQIIILVVIIILTRTIFMGYHYAPETRYIVEVYPLMIASSGVTFAFIWGILFEPRSFRN